ncbi:hypothetical protein D9613_012636 [Agrocybe pediades]|uniref:Uncharacterized protein n=1 Tax=Agrocybe pediades TaxID=84607 RepID=A0A8H4QXF4_9AGAR|nr:hypothetical protein D9613_012636 [Agrocybe pediades]
MVYSCLIDVKPDFATFQTNIIFNHLAATTAVSVATTSLVSTAVICLQIWRHTPLTSRSRKHYRNIVIILIESSAAYTVAVLFLAILGFNITGDMVNSYKAYLLSNFANAVSQIVSGLAPTLMVARLFVSSGQEDTEFSSARLPSDLISPAFQETGVHMTNACTDLEMQQTGEQEPTEAIQVVTRAEDQLEDVVENKRRTVL